MQFYRLITDAGFRNRVLLIFLILCVNKLGFYVTGGEEQYLAMAKQFFDPGWVPGSFTLTEAPGAQLLFQAIIGPFMAVLDFVQAVFLLRLINFALIAIPLGLIFDKAKFNLIETFALVQFLVIGPQSFLGGEWMIMSFEPKSVAYIFLFYSLYYLLESRYTRSVVFLAICTYFHLLVGGWFFIAVAIGILLHGQFTQRIRYLMIYVIAVIPLLAYVLYGYLHHMPASTGINLDWVYCYYRLPNHLGIFKDVQYFLSHHAFGVLATAGAFTFCLYRQRHLTGIWRKMNHLVIILLATHLVFVVIAFADHVFLDNSGGILLKTYPFRSSSIAYFMFILLLYAYLREKFSGHPSRKLIGNTLVAILIVLGILFSLSNVRRSIDSFRDPAFDEMAAYINKRTPEDAVFIIPDDIGMMETSFIRKAERDRFVIFKFVPYHKDKLLEWYTRLQERGKLRDDPAYITHLSREYGVDYLLSDKEYGIDALEVIYRNHKYSLYEVQ